MQDPPMYTVLNANKNENECNNPSPIWDSPSKDTASRIDSINSMISDEVKAQQVSSTTSQVNDLIKSPSKKVCNFLFFVFMGKI